MAESKSPQKLSETGISIGPKRRGRPSKPKAEKLENGEVAESAPAPVPTQKTVDEIAPSQVETPEKVEPKASAPAVSIATPTRDDVMATLQKLSIKVGLPPSIELLGKFGAKRMSELKESDYAAFVSGADELMNKAVG